MSTSKSISLCVSFFFVALLGAQTVSDFEFFSPNIIIEHSQAHTKESTSVKQDKNELQQSGFLLYQVYRNLISSQDGSPCRFYPTCSAYCRSAVIKNGLITGLVQGIDRLTRCNGLSPQKYSIDVKRRKLVDHVH